MGKRGEEHQSEVLMILRGADRPLSAYDVLAELRPSNPRIAPPTVYRALAALSDRGLIHRLESLNAFIACHCDDHQHAVLSICDDCGSVEETEAPELLTNLESLAAKSGFKAARHVVEVHGVCSTCDDGKPVA
ncbi:MAG: Fur family transcriptional regulator [Pseudomonadota bacterium]